ncbi:IKBZ inhibitor, partial [Pseudoatta argentina]
MAHSGRITPIRIEKWPLKRVSIPDCSSVSSLEEDSRSTESEDMSISPDTSCRSSADTDKSFDLDKDFREKLTKYEDIIEKIENLRLARNDEDNKDANENVGRTHQISNENLDNLEYQNSCKSGCHIDNEDINNNEDNVTTDDNKGCLPLNICDDKKRCHLYDGNSLDNDSESEQARQQEQDDSDDSDLIQRGPVKPNFQSPRALSYPYSMMTWLQTTRANDNTDAAYAVDYDKTAEQILRNKDYSEKLNPCLDQLSDSSRNQTLIGAMNLGMEPSWIEENNKDIFRNGDSSNDTAALPSIVVDDPGEESLMDILSHGGFQAALLSDTGSHSIPSPGAKTWSDSPASSYNYVVSRSNSRASSRAQSPGSATNLESPQMHVNVIGSPLGSPQVASTYRVPQTLSSSSSSNQSYSDVSSPNYQTSLNYQTEEQLGESLSGWKGIYESSGTIVNSSDTIDCALLQLVEQVIEEDKQGKALKEPQVVSNTSCFSSAYNDRCVSVQTLGSDVNPVSRECPGSDMRSEKLETCLGIPNTDSIQVGDLPINSDLVSVYASKGSTGGCAFVNRAVNGHATNMEPRYYESHAKNNQVNTPVVSQHDANTLHELGLTDETSPPSVFVPNDYQIPTMVSSFVSNHPQRNLNRGIVPWPSLNLPSVRASERLKEGLHPKEVERAMSNLLKKSIEELAATDEDGDTALMCLVGNPEELTKKKAYLVPLVERLGNLPSVLSMVNNRNEDALYLAAINCSEMPYVTGYLAAAMIQKGIDINQRLYHIRGDTLIHSVVARGDSHGEVLAELLTLKTVQGNPVFDLSRCNYDGRTALHIAVESHDPFGRGVKSLGITDLLLKNGANIKIKESKCGDTALHMAASLSCDPALVKILLGKATSNVVNETNYMYNTPLHMAAAVSSNVDLEKQKDVCRLLIQAGGQTNIQNRQGKTPLALVLPERKEAIKRIFYKKA